MSLTIFLNRVKNKVFYKTIPNYKKVEVEKEQKNRHHRSKHYKKLTDEEDELTDCKWDQIDPNNKVQMLGIAKYWFNSADDYDRWKETIEDYKRDNDCERFKSNFYYIMAKAGMIVPHKEGSKKRGITRLNFSKMFDICFVEHIDGWIKEIEIDNRKYINGKMQNEILNVLFGKKSTYESTIFEHLEYFDYFPAEIKGILTKMLNKGYLDLKELSDKKYYKSADNIKLCDGRYYV
jgi:hypothetical protein